MVKNIVYDKAHPECTIDLFLPENTENVPMYIYFHGGGLVGGNSSEAASAAEFLVKKGIAVASVNYRLYPNAAFPDYLTDCANAVAFLMNSTGYGSFSSFTLGGSSAGGYITMMLYFNNEYFASAGVDRTKINGYFFNAGQPTSHFTYLARDTHEDSRRVMIDKAAPIFYLDKQYEHPENEPYILIVCSDHDMMNRLEQNMMLKTAMLQFGFPGEKLTFKIYPNTTHCSYVSPASDSYLEDTLALITNSNGGKL